MGLYPEFLETDGLGGFAMGSIDCIPRRRYHSLLTVSLNPPVERMNLLNTVEVCVHHEGERYPLSSFYFNSGVVHPPLSHRLSSFLNERALPSWLHKLPSGIQIESSLFMSKQHPGTYMSWKLLSAQRKLKLTIRPLISCRNYHGINRANDAFRFESQIENCCVRWHPYDGMPGIVAFSSGEFKFNPLWYYDFLYEEERARGFDAIEDLASPGEFSFVLEPHKDAVLCFALEGSSGDSYLQKAADPVKALAAARQGEEKRREALGTALKRAADAYIVQRGSKKSIIAGYPWFTDWGRDTFISIRGLCIEGERLKDAESIFLAWIDAMLDGMMPNCFPDKESEPAFNSVDASLWFIIAAYEFLEKAKAEKYSIALDTKRKIEEAILAILDSYYKGTRFYIQADESDGLLFAGSYGTQLTWMDAAFGGYAFTPRSGKPVEIQALWINALEIGAKFSRNWAKAAEIALKNFEARFWDEQQNCLFDVIDVNGAKNIADPRLRPNQIFAVGGLPFQLLKGEKAVAVVSAVERHLLSSIGLRSLAQFEKEYKPYYEGDDYTRCTAYHQGTVWTWLIGAFIEAWVRVHRSTAKAKKDARSRFFEPLMKHLGEAGVGHLPEIADANEPHYPRGCPFQAWSVAEALRVDAKILKVENRQKKPVISETKM